MAEEKAEAAATEALASTGGGGGAANKIMLALTGVNLVATLAMGGILFMSFQKEKNKPAVDDIVVQDHASGAEGESDPASHDANSIPGLRKKSGAEFGKMVALEQFTVNLTSAGTSIPKFIRVSVSLEVPGDDVENELTQKMPQVRNVIIDLFNSKRVSDLATAQGRDYLKDEIKSALNSFLVTGKVRGVFFTSFVLTS